LFPSLSLRFLLRLISLKLSLDPLLPLPLFSSDDHALPSFPYGRGARRFLIALRDIVKAFVVLNQVVIGARG
jgi:hypothetical protein